MYDLFVAINIDSMQYLEAKIDAIKAAREI